MILLLCLLFLVLLGGIVTVAFSDSRWELRMAAQGQSEVRALTAARSALAWAEAWLLSRPGDG